MGGTPGDPTRDDPHRCAEVAGAKQSGDLLDAGVVAPLVHHEEPLRMGLGDPPRAVGVVAERLLDEDRYSVPQHNLEDLGWRRLYTEVDWVRAERA